MTVKKKTDFAIEAEAHSDDRAVEISFDALDWFRAASQKDIIELLKCDIGASSIGGDYGSDAIAIFMAETNSDLADMFKYNEIRHRIDRDVGFECHVVDYESAIEYLCKSRPGIFESSEWEEAVDGGFVDEEIIEMIKKHRIKCKMYSMSEGSLINIEYILSFAKMHNLWKDFLIIEGHANVALQEIRDMLGKRSEICSD